MPYGSEKDLSTRARALIAAALWLVIGLPMFVGLWFVFGWWVLIGVALGVWATIDYVRKGGTGDSVDRYKYGF